jgi:hypothetical protein
MQFATTPCCSALDTVQDIALNSFMGPTSTTYTSYWAGLGVYDQVLSIP